jgi:hypothetical protein
MREPRLGVSKPRRPCHKVDFRPCERDRFATPPARKREEARHREGNRPSWLGHAAECLAEGGVFVIRRATLALLVSVLLDPMSRIVGAKTLPDGIREDNAQKRERPRSGPSPASHAGEPMLPGFHTRRCCALADLIVESFDIKARDRRDSQIAKQRLYVALDAPSIGCQR